MELKMNRCEPSENTWEAWVAARRRDLAELHRLNTWTNLRRNHELRRAATRQPHPQAPTVAPPRPTTGERQRGGTPTVALEDNDIVEHVQGINESARSWFAESARKAIAQGRQHRPSRHDVATPKSNMRDPDLDVMTLKIVRSPTPQDRVLDFRQKMEPEWNDTKPLVCEYDNNANEVGHPPQQPPMRRYARCVDNIPQAAYHQQVKEHQQIKTEKMGEYEYQEENTVESDTWEPYLASDESYESDDDEHRDCGKGRYHACPDNPANFSMYDNEADDVTVIDVYNTRQEIHRGDSEAEPSSGGDRDSFGEDIF